MKVICLVNLAINIFFVYLDEFDVTLTLSLGNFLR